MLDQYDIWYMIYIMLIYIYIYVCMYILIDDTETCSVIARMLSFSSELRRLLAQGIGQTDGTTNIKVVSAGLLLSILNSVVGSSCWYTRRPWDKWTRLKGKQYREMERRIKIRAVRVTIYAYPWTWAFPLLSCGSLKVCVSKRRDSSWKSERKTCEYRLTVVEQTPKPRK